MLCNTFASGAACVALQTLAISAHKPLKHLETLPQAVRTAAGLHASTTCARRVATAARWRPSPPLVTAAATTYRSALLPGLPSL